MPTNRTHLEQVAARLALAIEATGESQAEVARTLGITPNKLGNWLRAANYPDEYLLTVFCDRYGVTMDFLYRGLIYGLAANVAADLAKAQGASGPALAAPARPARGRRKAAKA